MNRLVLPTALLLLLGGIGGWIRITPNTTGGPGGIRTNNVNTTNANSQIRLWILTAEQLKNNPPKTKKDASLLESFVQPRFRTFTFNRNAGNYVVVASNESYYQRLADNAPFTSGVDFSSLEVKVENKLIPLQVSNTRTTSLLPEIKRP